MKVSIGLDDRIWVLIINPSCIQRIINDDFKALKCTICNSYSKSDMIQCRGNTSAILIQNDERLERCFICEFEPKVEWPVFLIGANRPKLFQDWRICSWRKYYWRNINWITSACLIIIVEGLVNTNQEMVHIVCYLVNIFPHEVLIQVVCDQRISCLSWSNII